MTKKRRTSHNSQSSTVSNGGSGDIYLSTRTRKSISKSRRSSAVDEKPPSRRTSLAAAISLLSLPSFMEEVPDTSQLVNALDVHALYKVKVNRSSKKLDCFFGESTPIDVCVGEIIKEGLKAMLESKVPSCYFLYYLLDEFSSENLFFFLDVEHFENQYKKKNTVVIDQRAKAQRIFDKYISNNASLEINLDDRVKRNVTNQFSCADSHITQHVFSEAKTSVYVLLESSFTRFLHTRAYNDMLANCGELTIHYDEHTTGVALNYLVEYLRTQQEVLMMHSENNTALSDTLILLNLKHYELIKSAIQGFIRNVFGIEYLSNKSSWTTTTTTTFSVTNAAAKKVNKKKGRKK